VNYPTYKGTMDNKVVLAEDYLVKGVLIKKGFKSDGLTLKTIFLKLFIDKFSPKLSPFFFLHDKLCRDEKYIKADILGKEVLYEIEKSIRTKFGIHLIFFYHFIKYKKYRKYICRKARKSLQV